MTTKATEPALIEKEAKNEGVGDLIKKLVKHSPVGLTFDPKTTFEEWSEMHEFYAGLRDRTNWMIGDSIRFASTKFGEKYTQAVHITGREYSTLTTIVSVCERFDIARRRANLSFGFHTETAYLPPQEADYILDRAEREHWNRDEVREAVSKKSDVPTKTRKAASIAAQIAASGKTPQPAQGDPAAPVWNGYPVTTANGLLFTGSERIDVPEADHCAHYHGFTCAERMVKALEAAKQPETTAPAPAQPAPTPSPAPVESKSTPATLAAPEHQHNATERVFASINQLNEALAALDFSKVTVLTAKKMLKLSLPFDTAIDECQKITGATPTPRK